MEENTSDVIKIEAYHGTAEAYKDSILRERKMKKSSREDDWAGTGIYYFVDEKEEDLIKKCVLWALNIKRYKTAAVVKNVIEIDRDKILNLKDKAQQDMFQNYRQILYDRANQCAIKSGRKLSEKYRDMRKLDCLTTNIVCGKYGFDLVKRDAYINFYRTMPDNREYPRSDIPNATIINLRDESYITEWGECDAK